MASIDIRDTHERHERHHLFLIDKRMLGAGLAEEDLRPAGTVDAGVLGRERPGLGRRGPC